MARTPDKITIDASSVILAANPSNQVPDMYQARGVAITNAMSTRMAKSRDIRTVI